MNAEKWIGLISVYGYAAILETIYILISYFQTGQVMMISMLPWILFLCFLYGSDQLLLRRGTTVHGFLLWHIITGALYLLAMNLFWLQASGLAARVFAAIFAAFLIGLTEELTRIGIHTNQLLMQLELTISLMILLLFLEGMGVAPDSYASCYLILALVLELFSMIFARIYLPDDEGEERQSPEASSTFLASEHPEERKGYGRSLRERRADRRDPEGGSAWKGLLLLCLMLILLLGCAVLFLAACSDLGQMILQKLLHRMGDSAYAMLTGASQLMLWILSHLPQSKYTAEGMPTEAGESVSAGQTDLSDQDPGILLGILLLAAIFGLCLILYLIWKRFRAMTLQEKRLAGGSDDRIGRRRRSLRDRLRKWFVSLRRRVSLRWYLYRNPTCPQAILMRAERLGSRYHCKRKIYESPGVYMRRLAEVDEIKEAQRSEELLLQADFEEKSFYEAPREQ